jgi:hypothetical protein
MIGTSYFLLCAANPTSLICPSIHAAAWANPGNSAYSANSAKLICLPVHVAVLANPVNPTVVTRIFFLVRELCSNTYHPRVARPDHLSRAIILS